MANSPDSPGRRDSPDHSGRTPLVTAFKEHRDCDWHIKEGPGKRKYRGEVYHVLWFVDRTCSIAESMAMDDSEEYVVLSDQLLEDMGWAKDQPFLFGGAWFFKAGVVDECPSLGVYMPSLFYLNEHGVCDFRAA